MIVTATHRRRLVAAGVALTLALAACGGGDKDEANKPASTTAAPTKDDIVAQVASYDLVANRPQRVIVGLLTGDQRLVGFGTVKFSFVYFGTRAKPLKPKTPSFTATADYRLIPGDDITVAIPTEPTIIKGTVGRGVYGADDITFPDAGFWGVAVSATTGGVERRATANFEVAASSDIPAVGDEAPRTKNHLPGAKGVEPTAIDSRAKDDGSVPDPALHEMTVADAIAAGRPVMVVVSTPVYCVSQFCGPITDTVAELAARSPRDMAFVHIEVWRDFEGKALNAAAAEWMYPGGKGGANEPWVFVVGKDGRITARFDNVATEAEMESAIAKAVA